MLECDYAKINENHTCIDIVISNNPNLEPNGSLNKTDNVSTT